MFKNDLLQNKIILVTGGGSRLGLSMLKRFAELGATLVICGRTPERLASGAIEIQQASGGTRGVHISLRRARLSSRRKHDARNKR